MSATVQHRAGIRIDGDAAGFKAAATEAVAAQTQLNEATAKAAATERQAEQATAAASQAMGRKTAAAGQAAAAIDRAATSSKQYQQAMRQLPAQMTDVVTSLASGMPAWMVAIQQGGQIKDSFGGAGAAAKALTSLINPTTLAIGAFAAVAGTAAVVINHGTAEQRAYEAALRDTNNAAGVTIGQLNEMAKAVSAGSGTRSQAASVLAALTGTGKVDGADLERFTAVAVRSQRVLGTTVEQTVAAYTALGKDPVAASQKLNESMNYLTASTMAQIRALASQGKQAEAASLAQNAYADAMAKRTSQAEANLGGLERAWLAVKGAAAQSWEAMLNLGRKESLEEELERINKVLAEAPRRGVNAVQQALRRQQLEQRREEIRLQILQEREAAAAQSAATDREQKAIVDQGAAHQTALTNLVTAGDALRLARTNEALTKAEQASRTAYERGELGAKAHGDMLVTIERARIDAQLTQLDRLAAAEAAKSPTGDPDDPLRRQAALLQIETKRADLQERRARLEADIATGKFNLGPPNDPMRDFIEQQTAAQNKRDQERRQAQAEFLQGLVDDNARANIDLIQNDEERGRAQIELDRQIMARRIQLMGLTGVARETAERELADRSKLAATRLTESLKPEWQRMLEGWSDPVRQMKETFDAGVTEALRTGEAAWVQFALTGKRSVDELGQTIQREVASYAFRRLTSMILNLVSGSFGGGSDPYAGGWTGEHHGGGVIGVDSPSRMRWVPDSAFIGAPRFHSGFLAPDERTAVLRKDESVLTPGQMSQLAPVGRTQVQVTLVNQSGTPMEASATTKPDGGIEVLLTALKGSIAGDIGSGVGEIPRALQTRYGMRPTFSG